VKVIQFIQIFR